VNALPQAEPVQREQPEQALELAEPPESGQRLAAPLMPQPGK
jgi:hypothetical protein